MDQEFRLPMSTISLFRVKANGEVTAHNLDFDLVCSDSDQGKAKNKLRLAIKTYVEYGLKNNLGTLIRRPAPAEYWDQILDAKISSNVETICVRDWRIFATHHEIERPALQAA